MNPERVRGARDVLGRVGLLQQLEAVPPVVDQPAATGGWRRYGDIHKQVVHLYWDAITG
jgi:hypothetical protein